MSSRIGDRPQVQVQVRNTAARVTPRPAGERFRDALGQGASDLLTGVEQLAGLAPGGSVLTAAVRGAASAAQGGATASAEGPGGAGTTPGGMSSALADSTSQSMQLLELQQQISMEQRQFTTVSNVMKARHDTAKSVINNVR